MLNTIVHRSLLHRGVVIVLAGVVLAYGALVATRAKLDVFPDFVPPQVTVQTEAPGLSPEQVESLVTRPLETALSGLGGTESLRSESAQGLSVITVVFREGTPILAARQLLAERLGELAGTLPAGVRSPKMSPLVSATMDLLKIGLVSDRLTPMELRTFADWTLKPRLLAVPGVAKANVFGGEVPQWEIAVDPERLIQTGLALTDVLAAAQAASGVRGAGYIDTPAQRIVVQTSGQALTAEALGAVPVRVTVDGAPVRLRDIATVALLPAPKFGDSLVMGVPGVLLTLGSQYGANTLDSTEALEVALAEMAPIFEAEGITVYPALHRPATFIENALGNLRHSLLLGAVLVTVVLFLFLGHPRTALISLTAIPLSLLTAIILLDRFGVTLNTLTLGGLAIALGEVVDDAIIDVENILRRLRENRTAAQPRSALAVVLAASIEVRSAVVYATFIVALVFLPVLTLTGLQGSFFAPLAGSYLLAILASLVVALTVTPALALALLTGSGAAHDSDPPRWLGAVRGRYETLLGFVARHAIALVVAALVLVGAAVARLPYLGGEFLPEFREGHFVVGVAAAPGTSLDEMRRIGARLSERWLADERIATVEQQIGRAEQGEDPWGPHRSEFHIELQPGLGAGEADVAEMLRTSLEQMPGVQSEVMTFLGDRIGESISGETAAVVLNVFGEDFATTDATARTAAAKLNAIAGARDVQIKAPAGAPRVAVDLDPVRLAERGFRSVDVLEAIQTAVQGAVVGQIFDQERVTDIAVTLPMAGGLRPEDLGRLLLRNLAGQLVRLDAIADVHLATGRFSILHDGGRRRQTVTCNVAGRDVASFAAEARRMLGGLKLPHGVYWERGGTAEAQAAAMHELWWHAAIAGVGIVLLLSIVLGSWSNVLLVLCNLPFALVGGVLALWVAGAFGGEGGTLNMGSMVGFVTLFGITTRNAIMLISHYEHLVTDEGQEWAAATAIRGASERLIPILMTALVTGLALLPLALGSGEAGREIEGPMAVVILGGLFTSTGLNLLLLPALATRFLRLKSTRGEANVTEASC